MRKHAIVKVMSEVRILSDEMLFPELHFFAMQLATNPGAP
jgi:hypothetical protein